jgi:hypothetical protein
MALVAGRANARLAAHTGSRQAGITLGTGVVVCALAAILLLRIIAKTCGWITNSGIVTAIERRAHHVSASKTGPLLTSVRLGAKVPILASGAVCRRRRHALGSFWVAHTSRALIIEHIADDRLARFTAAALAVAGFRAVTRVAIITIAVTFAGTLGHVVSTATSIFLASVHGAVAFIITFDSCAHAGAGLAGIVVGANQAVVARGTVGSLGSRTLAGLWIALTVFVAVIRGRAVDGLRAYTLARLTRVELGAHVVVVARLAVWLRDDATLSRLGIRLELFTRPGLFVTLDDLFLGPDALARVAGIPSREEVTIIALEPIIEGLEVALVVFANSLQAVCVLALWNAVLRGIAGRRPLLVRIALAPPKGGQRHAKDCQTPQGTYPNCRHAAHKNTNWAHRLEETGEDPTLEPFGATLEE